MLTGPPALTVVPDANVALELLLTMLIVIAPAIVTAPLPSEPAPSAAGVLVLLVVFPSAVICVLSAEPSCLSAFWLAVSPPPSDCLLSLEVVSPSPADSLSALT